MPTKLDHFASHWLNLAKLMREHWPTFFLLQRSTSLMFGVPQRMLKAKGRKKLLFPEREERNQSELLCWIQILTKLFQGEQEEKV